MTITNTILREALALFEKEGIHKFTEKDLQHHLTISEATYKSLFKNKEDLVLQAYLRRLEDDKVENERIINQAANPVEQLLGLIERGSKQLINITPAYIKDIQEFPAVMEAYMRHSQEYAYPQVYGILNEGVTQGYLRREMNIGIVSKIIMENVLLLLNTRVFPPNSYNAREIFRNIYLYYFRGLCNKEYIDLTDRYFS